MSIVTDPAETVQQQPRCFLLLQSVCSPFFRRLASALELAGHRVVKLNFTVGDSWYHWPLPALSFRDQPSQLPAFLQQLYQQYGVTDQILFGDQRPLHQQALLAGRQAGVRNFVFEEGYFRPFWVTLEREGVNADSLLPRDPQWFLQAAALLAAEQPVMPAAQTFANPFWLRALHDVLYHCGNFWNPLFYPRYRSHALLSAPKEYLGYLWRLPAQRWFARRDAPVLRALQDKRWFLLPLQLDGDAQIRLHSSFGDMREVICTVLQSFQQQAPADCHLLIKNHPLDTGWVNFGAYIRQQMQRLGLQGRVHYVQSGDLALWLPVCAGVVTVNSTVGLQALQAGKPVITLGKALYNLPGLTFQGQLDDFWQQAAQPQSAADSRLLAAVIRVLHDCTQLNGSLYAEPGLSLLVTQSVAALCRERSPVEELCAKMQ